MRNCLIVSTFHRVWQNAISLSGGNTIYNYSNEWMLNIALYFKNFSKFKNYNVDLTIRQFNSNINLMLVISYSIQVMFILIIIEVLLIYVKKHKRISLHPDKFVREFLFSFFSTAVFNGGQSHLVSVSLIHINDTNSTTGQQTIPFTCHCTLGAGDNR